MPDKCDTTRYYNDNSTVFFEETVGADVTPLYERFLQYVPEGGKILDLGCASLLHVPCEELPKIIGLMRRALKPSGVMYMSYKYGDYEGDRDGRFFNDMTEEKGSAVLTTKARVVFADTQIRV